MKISIIVFSILCIACLLFSRSAENMEVTDAPSRDSIRIGSQTQSRYIDKALAFTRKKGYDTAFSILVDYGMHSGRKRAFLVDPSKKQVLDSFLVSHGCGANAWGFDESRDNPGFSNLSGSHCSSLGRYRIGSRGYSDWGINIKYYLYGLDTSNSNAYKRTIVLHGWDQVGDKETYPSGTPEGWGCPAVSEHAMTVIDSFLQTRKKPVLMWVYAQ